MDQKKSIEEKMSAWNWSRWNQLGMAALAVLNLWNRETYCQRMTAADLLSQREMEVLYAEQDFFRLVLGVTVFLFLFRFAVWRLPKPALWLINGSVWLTVGVLWAASAALLRFSLLKPWETGFWWLLLLALVGFGIYNLWNYHKLRKTTLDIV